MTLPRLRWLILFLLFLSTVINYVDRQALSVLLPTLRGELGISSSECGTITTLFLPAYTIGQLFARGGCAGIAAAARNGATTLLIERAGFSGGIIITVGLPYFDGLIDKPSGRFVVKGIALELQTARGVAKTERADGR